MKEFLKGIKKQVIAYVIWAEVNLLGAPGSVKREAVINKIVSAIDIPWVPEFIERPLETALVGFFVDLAVEKLNWLTGYSFADVQISEESQERLAEVVEAPVMAVAKAAAYAGPDSSVDDRINALYEQYGIKTGVAEPMKEIPQQETIQAPVTPVVDQWDKILSFILKYEGGYVNDPDDPGGETNRGITKATLAAAYASGIVKHNVVKNVTREDASKIYKARYYANYGYDKLPFALSLAVTDTTVNCGRVGAAKIVQKALVSLGMPLTIDGKWGPKTQAALESAAGNRSLPSLILAKRKNYYDDIIRSNPTQRKFRTGWYNRLKALAAEAGVQSPV
jgi:lysozyme family protein